MRETLETLSAIRVFDSKIQTHITKDGHHLLRVVAAKGNCSFGEVLDALIRAAYGSQENPSGPM